MHRVLIEGKNFRPIASKRRLIKLDVAVPDGERSRIPEDFHHV